LTINVNGILNHGFIIEIKKNSECSKCYIKIHTHSVFYNE